MCGLLLVSRVIISVVQCFPLSLSHNFHFHFQLTELISLSSRWKITCISSHYIFGSVLSSFPFTSLSLSVDRIDLSLQSMENYLCLQPSIMSSVFLPTTTAKNQQPAGHICYFCKYLLRSRISNRKSKNRKDIPGVFPLFFCFYMLLRYGPQS